MRRVMLPWIAGVVVASGCGATSALRPPNASERPTVVHAVTRFAQPPAHSRLHVAVRAIRVLRSDPRFVSAAVQSVDARGRHARVGGETAVVVLRQAAGTWHLVAGPGTAFFDYCSRPTSKPLKALLCPDAYANLGIG